MPTLNKHTYDRAEAERWSSLSISTEIKTFSVGIFKWVATANGKNLKPSKALVRVHGHPSDAEKVFKMADDIVQQLDNGTWGGKKSVKVC